MKSVLLSFLLLPLAALCTQLSAQGAILSPEEAVRIALENNYDIRIAQGDADIAHLNNTKGNAGMLPNVNLVVNENFTLSAFQQKLANGNEFVSSGAPFNAANAGVQLAWTVFDGRRMFIAKNRLEQTDALGQLNLKNSVQTTAANILAAYYDITRSRMQEKALQEVIALNEERLRIAEARLAAGFAAQTDALQARIDLNQRKADLILQKNTTETAKRNLNRLLARAADTPFETQQSIENIFSPDFNSTRDKVLAQNPTVLSFQKSAEIAAILVEENRTLNKPRITGNAQLSAQRTDNGAGFLLNNTQAGFTVGAGLVLPLYTGGNVQRQVETARVAAMQAQIRVDNQRAIVETELANQFAALEIQRQLLALEEENLKAARENLSVSTERFRVGTTNGLEPQTAQNTLEQSLARRDMVLYNLKIAELRIRLLSGELQ